MADPNALDGYGELVVTVAASSAALAANAAAQAARVIRSAGDAVVMFATGNSQLAFLDALAGHDLDWYRVTCFHMDEYLGMADDHPASFRRYGRERVETRFRPRAFHYIQGDAADPAGECERYAELLSENPLDLCCLGIGENGHLAFNDPSVADFDDPVDLKVVELDDVCRAQQVGEGHFATIDDVPTHAITVTIPALLRATDVVVVVPDERKAEAVSTALTGPIAPACPASILREQAHAHLYLDPGSASLL